MRFPRGLGCIGSSTCKRLKFCHHSVTIHVLQLWTFGLVFFARKAVLFFFSEKMEESNSFLEKEEDLAAEDADISFLCRYRRQFQSLAAEMEHLRSSDLRRKKEELKLISEINELKRKINEDGVQKRAASAFAAQQQEAAASGWRRDGEQQQREIAELRVKLCKF